MARVLCIPDLHIPSEHENALAFAKKIYTECECDTVVFLGDIFDLHRASFHDHDPEMPSLAEEINLCRERIQDWVAAFPRAYVAEGNHDIRLQRVANKAGIPSFCLRDINEVFGLPDTWQWADQHIIDGVKYKHYGPPGPQGHYKAVTSERMSVVYGHIHSFAGIVWSASKQDLLFAFNVGWLGDEEMLAFRYARSFVNRGVVGLGTVLDGKHPVFHPMDLGTKVKIITKPVPSFDSGAGTKTHKLNSWECPGLSYIISKPIPSFDGVDWLRHNHPHLLALIPAQISYRLKQIKNVSGESDLELLPQRYYNIVINAIKTGDWNG